MSGMESTNAFGEWKVRIRSKQRGPKSAGTGLILWLARRLSTTTLEHSESRMDCLNNGCDMRVSFSLLTNSQDDGASPWNMTAVVLEVIGAMTRLMMCLGISGRKRHSCDLVHRGVGMDGRTIVACTVGKRYDPRLSPALILLGARG